MCEIKVHQPSVKSTREMLEYASSEFTKPTIVVVKKAFPKHNQVRCSVSMLVVVLGGSGMFQWWHHKSNSYKDIEVVGEQLIKIPRGWCFRFSGDLRLLFMSPEEKPFSFERMEID